MYLFLTINQSDFVAQYDPENFLLSMENYSERCKDQTVLPYTVYKVVAVCTSMPNFRSIL